MMIPSNELVCRTLFCQAADNGRAQVFFGPDWEKICEAALQNAKLYCRAWAGGLLKAVACIGIA